MTDSCSSAEDDADLALRHILRINHPAGLLRSLKPGEYTPVMLGRLVSLAGAGRTDRKQVEDDRHRLGLAARAGAAYVR
jgi:hypothetical protein